MGDEEPMVTAAKVSAETGIPKSTIYYLAKQGRITFKEERVGWNAKKRLLFKVSQVRRELGLPQP